MRDNQVVEAPKISGRSLPLQSAHPLCIRLRIADTAYYVNMFRLRLTKGFRLSMVAHSPEDDVSRVEQFPDDKAAGYLTLLRSVLIGLHLRKPQKHIPRNRTCDARKEPS